MGIQSGDPDDLAARVEALERGNRRWRGLAAAAFVGILGLVSLGQAAPDGAARVVRTQRLEVLDEEGKTRLALGFYSDGSPMIELRRQDQSRAVVLHVAKDGSPAVACTDAQGKARTVMGLQPDGWGLVAVSDGDGVPRVTLNADPAGSASVRLADPGKVLRAVLGSVTIADKEKDSTRTTSPATLTLFDPTGLKIYQVP